MSRTIYGVIVLIIALTPMARSQTPTTGPKNAATLPVGQVATKPKANSTTDDCACDSQILPEVLSIVNGISITSKDIEKATGEKVRQLQRQVIEARKRELDLMINSKLLATEAKKRGISTTKLLEQEVAAKVKRPTPAEAQAFYDQNKARINEEFKDVAEEISAYMLDQRQRTEAKKFADGLREASETKVLVTEVTPPANAAERARVLATVKGEKITSGHVEDSLLPLISNVQEQVYKLRKDELDLSINDALLTQEAQKRKITASGLLDTEVKPKPVTDEDARTFYDQNKERISGEFTETKDAIKRYLEQIEVRKAERALSEKLRATASIQVFLIAPSRAQKASLQD